MIGEKKYQDWSKEFRSKITIHPDLFSKISD